MNSEIPKLLLATINFEGHNLIEWTIVESKTDFGFMSSIYEAQLTTQGDDGIEHRFDLIIKVMKGDEYFRLSSQSYTQFQNEICFYEKILPHFNKYLVEKGSKVIDLNKWLPMTYLSQNVESTLTVETILVQQNIQKIGFQVEESLYLTVKHLNVMIECLAKFHAVSLALKIENEENFLCIAYGIQPLCFEQPNGLPSLYDVLHEISTTRLFEYVASQTNLHSGFIEDINQLRKVVGSKPVALLDRFRQIDTFAVIGHGDFHRNNLLFKKTDNNEIGAMKMIDFQQIRYGSPCLDLSFFMYLNISAELRERLWDEMLRSYHRQLVQTIAEILNISLNDSRLTHYSYERFNTHCQRFFLYGALISASFTPWLLTSKLETDKVAHLFQTNMFDDKYREFALVVGGEAANKRVLGDMMHASERGYMKMLYD